MVQLYDSPHHFEPLLPSAARQEPLLARAHELARASASLTSLRAPQELRALLRAMNSYYTNRIEGQHTRPRELEQALHKDFSADVRLAGRQRLALAHIDAEIDLETRYAGETGVAGLFSAAAVADIHNAVFARLPESDRISDQGAAVGPGVFRQTDVSVGRHVAPAWQSVPSFLDRWASFYGSVRRGEATMLAMAASHQRLGWVHPFVDGNGRVMRLHTHTLLSAVGYTGGLWSPLRGFARSVDRYYAALSAADEPRRGDLDGRGNLSEAALVAWIEYLLDVCLDQVEFMRGMIDVDRMDQRIAACLVFEEQTLRSGVRIEALHALHYLFLSGADLERGEFKRMTGLGERTAVTLLGALLRRGLLRSDSPQGKLRFGLPMHALRFYFPALWPEAEADS
ncbi:MAG TPA: Fic family protein [Rubrivivax sp.]|nr:Fic family protein [Rubrivivax sp.]